MAVLKPAQKTIIVGYGLFLGSAVCFIQAGMEILKEKIKNEAVQQEPLEPSGIDRSINRDGRTGLRDIQSDSSEYRDDSRDGRTRSEYREGSEESNNISSNSGGGNIDPKPGS